MFSWMRWLLKKLNLETDAQRLASTMDKLNKTLKKLKKKAQAFKKNASQEVEKAKEFIRAGDRGAAILCLKRKRLYEQPIEPLRSLQIRIHNQLIKLEGVKATTETADALKIGAAAMQEMQKATNIHDMDKTMDETNRLMANMKQIQDLLSTLIDAATNFDEDELEAELKELEGADPLPERIAEEDEPAASLAEMAL